MQDIFAVVAGSLVGFVLGLVGGGGSILAVPLLLYGVGVPSAHMAIGTSAVAVSLSAFANLLQQMRTGGQEGSTGGLVKWPCALVFSACGIAGTFAGSSLALRVSGARLIPLFGVLMIAVGVLMVLRKNAEGDPGVRLNLATARRMLPWLVSSGLAVGTLSGFFGIGGGFLIVPALMMATGMPIRNAIATSLVAITCFGAATAVTYTAAGQVDWRIAGFFVGGGIAGGIFGTLASRTLGTHKRALSLVFAGFVIVTGVYVILRSLAGA